jgi:hypothetical protein
MRLYSHLRAPMANDLRQKQSAKNFGKTVSPLLLGKLG